MPYEMLCTSADTTPVLRNAYTSMLASGVHDFTIGNEWQFYLSYRSSGYSMYEKSDGSFFRVDTQTNDMLILPPYTHHIDHIKRTTTEYDGFLIAASCGGDVLPTQFSKIAANSRIVTLFERFRLEWERRLPGYLLRSTIFFYQILDELATQSRSLYMDSRKYRLIAPAIEYIHTHYQTGRIAITTIAELCGITPQYFTRLFTGCMGVSPARYIETLRLQRAKELLETGKYSVNDVIMVCGYENASNFARSFRHQFGIVPSSLLTKCITKKDPCEHRSS